MSAGDLGRKDDNGTLRYDLIPPGPLEDLARVYTLGAAKYADRNWERGLAWGRVFAAIMRHLWAWWRGEDTDPESGLSHAAHAAWGCFALLEYARTHPELDDRPGRDGERERNALRRAEMAEAGWENSRAIAARFKRERDALEEALAHAGGEE